MPPAELPLELVFRAVFLVCDVIAIAIGHWDFNDRDVTGWEIPGGVPDP